MIEIDFKNNETDFSLVFLRSVFVLILIVHVLFKLDNPAHDLTSILALLAIALTYHEVKRQLPSRLEKVVLAQGAMDFIYAGPVGAMLTVNLPVSDRIVFKRSFWSNRVSVTSGSTTVRLPWFLSQKDQEKIQSLLAKSP